LFHCALSVLTAFLPVSHQSLTVNIVVLRHGSARRLRA
jgi:hypothetical protein